jgi:hypothetical protein
MSVAWHLGPDYTSGVDYNTATAASGTSVTVSKPSGLVDGQTLRAFFYSQVASGATATAPSGWTLERAPSSRRGGVYRKVVTDADAEPANYTWSTANSGRQLVAIWLCDGEDDSPVDIAGVFAAESTSATAAAVTATVSDGFLATFGYWNNSSTTVTTLNYPGGMTDLLDLNSPTTGNTSGLSVGFEQLSASGTTGSRVLTGTPTPVNMSAVNIVYVAAPVPVTLTGTGTITAEGSVGGGGAQSKNSDPLAGTGSITAAGVRNLSATAVLAGGGTATMSVTEMDARITAGRPVHWAHRGGSANWSEMTMYAYDNAYAAGARVFEVSVHRSSDGVWIMSHDATLTRVTATSYTIVDTNSATMLGLAVDTPSTGGVIGRLEDVLDAYGDKVVILVDNKPGSWFSEFLDLLETYPNAHDQFIVKLDGQFGSTANFAAAKARGFKVAGYWYPNNYETYLPARADDTDYIGMQYDATTTEWADIFAYGKTVWGHVIQDQTQYNLCATAGVDIFQLANVEDLMPPETPTVIAATGQAAIGYAATGEIAGTGSITAAGATDKAATGTLTGTGTLSAAGQAELANTVTRTGTGSLTAAGQTGISSTATLAGTGSLASAPHVSSAAARTGTGSITAAGVKNLLASSSLAGAGSITASAVPQGQAERTGTGSITAAGVAVVSAGATLAGTGSLQADTATSSTATRTGTGSITAAGGGSGQLTASLDASASTTAEGLIGTQTAASLSGVGELVQAGVLGTSKPSGLAGNCALAAAGLVESTTLSGITGTGAIAAVGGVNLIDWPTARSLTPSDSNQTYLIPSED